MELHTSFSLFAILGTERSKSVAARCFLHFPFFELNNRFNGVLVNPLKECLKKEGNG